MNTNPGELTPKQQAAESIRQAGNILIMTGQHPTNDQITAVLALSMLLRKLDKRVTAVISDNIPATLNFLPLDQLDKNLSGMRDFVLKLDLAKAEVDKLKYTVEDGKLNIHITPFKGGFSPTDVSFGYGSYHYDLLIVLGVPTRARIDKVFTQTPGGFSDIPMINIDFHRSNEQYGAVNHIDGYASSLCEILTALAESVQNGMIDEEIATILLTGIIAATDRFTATHTTAKSLTVAAQLMAAGAKQQTIVKNLYKSGRTDSRTDVKKTSSSRREAPAEKTTVETEFQVRPSDARPESASQAENIHEETPTPQAAPYEHASVDTSSQSQETATTTSEIQGEFIQPPKEQVAPQENA